MKYCCFACVNRLTQGVNRLTLLSFARKRVLCCVNRLTQGVNRLTLLERIEMAGRGRDDAAIAEALGMLAGVLGGNPNVVGMGASRQLSEFQKNNPSMFKGAYDPEDAQKWLKEIERIFRVTECADN
ncbi:hypothetical protein KIW84_013269 [Lathyrus oleraceus]|uniref:Cellular nucleic acid-binding protein n=1 Tax=Pisum sativum TaxID=3888 RepID=A0A9D5BJU9_PEA|nr:hypothetical protein KIW84_013269 [Pisum sativum]